MSIPANLSKAEFTTAIRLFFEDGGHSYDPWDLAWLWRDYQEYPGNYEYIAPFIQERT